MSRFVYQVYRENLLIGKFTSINAILQHIKFSDEQRNAIIAAFKIPQFQKRLPQVYVDNSIGLKIESDYLVYTGKLYI